MSTVCFLNKRMNCAIGLDHNKSRSDLAQKPEEESANIIASVMQAQSPQGKSRLNTKYPKEIVEDIPDQGQQ